MSVAAMNPRRPKAGEDFLPLLGRYIRISYPSGGWVAGKLAVVSESRLGNDPEFHLISLLLEGEDGFRDFQADVLGRYTFEVLGA